MFLHKRSNGFYYVHYRNESGKWQSITTRTKVKTEAHKFFSNLKENLKPKKSSPLLSGFIKDYLIYSQTNHSPQTTVRIQFILNHFSAFIGDKSLAKISIPDLEAYKSHRLASISPVTVNIELRTLKAFLNTAVKWSLVGDKNFKNLKLVRLPEQSPVYLSHIDVKTLISSIRMRWLRDIVLFAINTGMRRGEVINLKWEDVDISRAIVKVRNTETFTTKSKSERIIPLNTAAINIIKELAILSEYVFVNSEGNKLIGRYVSECFGEAIDSAGLNPKLHFHSLRHTFASWLVQDGVSLYEVQKLLGHSNISVTQVYSHLQPEKLHATVNRISIPLN